MRIRTCLHVIIRDVEYIRIALSSRLFPIFHRRLLQFQHLHLSTIMSTESAIIPRTPVPGSAQAINFLTPFSVFDCSPETCTFIDMDSKVTEEIKVPEVGWLSC